MPRAGNKFCMFLFLFYKARCGCVGLLKKLRQEECLAQEFKASLGPIVTLSQQKNEFSFINHKPSQS